VDFDLPVAKSALDSIPIFQARHLVTMRKAEVEATDRQIR